MSNTAKAAYNVAVIMPVRRFMRSNEWEQNQRQHNYDMQYYFF